MQNTHSQYNLPPFGKKLVYAANREELAVAERFTDPSVKKSVEVDLDLIDHLDASIAELELYLTRTVKVDDVHTCERLRTIPGVGPVLAPGAALRVSRYPSVRDGGPVPVLRAAGAVRPRVGGQEAVCRNPSGKESALPGSDQGRVNKGHPLNSREARIDVTRIHWSVPGLIDRPCFRSRQSDSPMMRFMTIASMSNGRSSP